MVAPILTIRRLVAGYGGREIISDVSMEVARGEIVALIGHNGAGKSTLLKCIFGLIPALQGEIVVNGKTMTKTSPRERLSTGISYIPQGNRVFRSLTVEENLDLGGYAIQDVRKRRQRVRQVLDIFPVLRDRLKQRAATMSGGERQILAMANALILSPQLLLADEPSLGLAPALAAATLGSLRILSEEFGTAVVVVEQRVRAVLNTSQRVYVLRRGRVAFSGWSADLDDDTKLRAVYL